MLTLIRTDSAPVAYRHSVVELPWPDRFGRIVLVSLDANGRIFDQRVAESEYEAQILTDHMMDNLGVMR